MFTGLVCIPTVKIPSILNAESHRKIEHLGTVSSILVDAGGCTLTIADSAAILGDCHIGDSIAVNGACLTVTEFNVDEQGGWFKVWLANETLDRTDLGVSSAVLQSKSADG